MTTKNTRREIDHLTVAALATLTDGETGLGYVSGFDFEATRNADGLSVEIAVSNMETGFNTRISMPMGLIRAQGAVDLCRYIRGRIEARGGLEVSGTGPNWS
jgi:hypothetical protein